MNLVCITVCTENFSTSKDSPPIAPNFSKIHFNLICVFEKFKSFSTFGDVNYSTLQHCKHACMRTFQHKFIFVGSWGHWVSMFDCEWLSHHWGFEGLMHWVTELWVRLGLILHLFFYCIFFSSLMWGWGQGGKGLEKNWTCEYVSQLQEFHFSPCNILTNCFSS